jgi:hypothetical protein
MRTIVALTCLLSATLFQESGNETPSYPSFDYHFARKHEVQPHRRTVPLKGVLPGFNQLRLALTVSPAGDVVDAHADGEPQTLKFWPQLEDEVRQWKFIPIEVNGKAVAVLLEEYIDLVPPERRPKRHVPAPALRPDSKVSIALERTGCYGTCPSYSVTVSTEGIAFEGSSFVVAQGKHTANVNADEVRHLAKRFAAADFYSMDSHYRASVTDNPTYILTITVDGHTKSVEDYVGSWEGMPAVISELENQVDDFARTEKWIDGGQGLVPALRAEKFDFETFDAQLMLKKAARAGQTITVRELLDAGVPLEPKPATRQKKGGMFSSFESDGWLTAASRSPETLQVLIDALASEKDQIDKNIALASAARSGSVPAVQALIAYGADPNADLSKLTVTESSGGMTMGSPGAGSILMYAAESGNPELVREILRYHPDLEARDRDGKTAVFSASEYRYDVDDAARAECVRLLAQAGANVNARDSKGNTPLHETFLNNVEIELLKLGANVNARNNDGETPIFTTVDNTAILLFIEHGADLTIRNNEGDTVIEAARKKGPSRQKALRQAIQKFNQR